MRGKKFRIPNNFSEESSRFWNAVHGLRNNLSRYPGDVGFLISSSGPERISDNNYDSANLIITLTAKENDDQHNTEVEMRFKALAQAAGLKVTEIAEEENDCNHDPWLNRNIRRPKVGEIVHFVVDYPDMMSRYGGHGCRPAIVIEVFDNQVGLNLQILLASSDGCTTDQPDDGSYSGDANDKWLKDSFNRFFRYECANSHESVDKHKKPWHWKSKLWIKPCPHEPWHWHHIDECEE